MVFAKLSHRKINFGPVDGRKGIEEKRMKQIYRKGHKLVKDRKRKKKAHELAAYRQNYISQCTFLGGPPSFFLLWLKKKGNSPEHTHLESHIYAYADARESN